MAVVGGGNKVGELLRLLKVVPEAAMVVKVVNAQARRYLNAQNCLHILSLLIYGDPQTIQRFLGVFSVSVCGSGRFFIPADSLIQIGGNAFTFFVHFSKDEGRPPLALGGRFREPVNSFGKLPFVAENLAQP